jgi:hypothetical protein
MKVNVLQVKDVTISRWHWWSNWIDIAIYDYECRPWLIQMRVSRTNRKQFKSVCISGESCKQVQLLMVGDLTQMLREDK